MTQAKITQYQKYVKGNPKRMASQRERYKRWYDRKTSTAEGRAELNSKRRETGQNIDRSKYQTDYYNRVTKPNQQAKRKVNAR